MRARYTLGVAMAVLLLLTGCGVPTEDTPERIDPKSVPYDLLERTPGPSSPGPVPE